MWSFQALSNFFTAMSAARSQTHLQQGDFWRVWGSNFQFFLPNSKFSSALNDNAWKIDLEPTFLHCKKFLYFYCTDTIKYHVFQFFTIFGEETTSWPVCPPPPKNDGWIRQCVTLLRTHLSLPLPSCALPPRRPLAHLERGEPRDSASTEGRLWPRSLPATAESATRSSVLTAQRPAAGWELRQAWLGCSRLSWTGLWLSREKLSLCRSGPKRTETG